jgi:hypothetical protein
MLREKERILSQRSLGGFCRNNSEALTRSPFFLELLQWMLTSGQNQCSALGYVPLPREIASRELQLLPKL